MFNYLLVVWLVIIIIWLLELNFLHCEGDVRVHVVALAGTLTSNYQSCQVLLLLPATAAADVWSHGGRARLSTPALAG